MLTTENSIERLRQELAGVRDELAAIGAKVRDAGSDVTAIEKLMVRKLSLEVRDSALIDEIVAAERRVTQERVAERKAAVAEFDVQTKTATAAIKAAKDAFDRADREYSLFQSSRRRADSMLKLAEEQLREFPARERKLRTDLARSG
ncbi:MAG: hypothetical protein ACREJX_12860 [Polyangiaceae bacterium]